MIPLVKPILGKEEKESVMKVIESGAIAQGEFVKEFEEKFANFVGTDHAVATTNGTQALILALDALNIKGEVLVPSFSFIASATSIIAVGAKPVFADVDSKTFNLNPNSLQNYLTDKTEAIMPVHLFGQTCDMASIKEFAEKHDLKIIEDACQAHGAKYDDKFAGNLGDCGCFSFYPTKNMTTSEGGIVTTNDKKLVDKMKLFRNHGMKTRYYHDHLGYNFRMTNIQAAIGLEQLKKLPTFNEKRIENAKYYNMNLKGVITPKKLENCKHVYHQYTIKTDKREELTNKLKEHEIGFGIYYPVGIHKQKIIVERFGECFLPVTEKICDEVLSLPIYPGLSKHDLDAVIGVINSLD